MDYSILDKLGLEFMPVGVKFSMVKPAHLPRLNKKLAICEMLRETQLHGGFYAAHDDHACGVGPHILGQSEEDPGMVGGMIGPKISVYSDARANRNVYLDMKTLAKGTGPYTWFDTLEHSTFDPDLMILLTRPNRRRSCSGPMATAPEKAGRLGEPLWLAVPVCIPVPS